MATQAYFILSAAQGVEVAGFNNPEVGYVVQPFPVTVESPGTCLNANGLSEDYALDAVVDLTGKLVIPYRVFSDPEYLRWMPDGVDYLIKRAVASLASEAIFAPIEEEV